jgi:formate hydrogenlyase subunit 6/NADH:ubiquinone oxidoreductase subunit I
MDNRWHPMVLYSLIAGPLLTSAFLIFFSAMTFRLLAFAAAVHSRDRKVNDAIRWRHSAAIFARALIPMHRLSLRRPFYVISRYGLHLGLVLMPLFIPAHNILFKIKYGFGMATLPEALTDVLTLAVIISVLLLLLRRVGCRTVRERTSARDMGLIVVALAPFVTGFMAYHQVLSYDFWVVAHILSGEVMLVAAAFLFVRVNIQPEGSCVACAACTNECPSGALTYSDQQTQRVIRYNSFRCIGCATCQAICPDQAVTLGHELSFKRLFQISGVPLKRVELTRCNVCAKPFVPVPQLAKIEGIVARSDLELDSLNTCETCKRRRMARV